MARTKGAKHADLFLLKINSTNDGYDFKKIVDETPGNDTEAAGSDDASLVLDETLNTKVDFNGRLGTITWTQDKDDSASWLWNKRTIIPTTGEAGVVISERIYEDQSTAFGEDGADNMPLVLALVYGADQGDSKRKVTAMFGSMDPTSGSFTQDPQNPSEPTMILNGKKPEWDIEVTPLINSGFITIGTDTMTIPGGDTGRAWEINELSV